MALTSDTQFDSMLYGINHTSPIAAGEYPFMDPDYRSVNMGIPFYDGVGASRGSNIGQLRGENLLEEKAILDLGESGHNFEA